VRGTAALRAARALADAFSMRGVGHTTAMQRGSDTSICHVVGLDERHARLIGGKKGVSIDSFADGRLRGSRNPVVVDHAVLASVLYGLIGEIEELRALIPSHSTAPPSPAPAFAREE
jgi:hypothetical protein